MDKKELYKIMLSLKKKMKKLQKEAEMPYSGGSDRYLFGYVACLCDIAEKLGFDEREFYHSYNG